GRGVRGERPHHAGVAVRDVVDLGRPCVPGALQVDHDAAAPGEGVVRGERLRADKAGLFAVGEQQYDVVAGPRPRGEGAGDLQDRGDRGLVVGGTGRGGGRVVVRGDQDRPGRVG